MLMRVYLCVSYVCVYVCVSVHVCVWMCKCGVYVCGIRVTCVRVPLCGCVGSASTRGCDVDGDKDLFGETSDLRRHPLRPSSLDTATRQHRYETLSPGSVLVRGDGVRPSPPKETRIGFGKEETEVDCSFGGPFHWVQFRGGVEVMCPPPDSPISRSTISRR